MLVAAVALIDAHRRVLLQKRRFGAVHGGFWEFPGGELESGESAQAAAAREIDEELGLSIAAGDLVPVSFSCTAGDQAQPLVLLLFVCRTWTGEPQCRAGEAIAWFALEELDSAAMPPLDVPLIAALRAFL